MALDTRELLARLIKCEAGGEGDTGMRAVASVIINRSVINSGEFARVSNGGDVRAIITQPCQFTCLKEVVEEYALDANGDMKLSKQKYIFVTGGVASSLGKGIISASIARLLQARGYSVTIQKLDPYINVDPGTLNPYEHGECYVTEDGTETDLDLGHYERFTSIQTTKNNNVTTGKIYQCVIDKERSGEFLGKTVQVIPHITDEIKRRIQLLGTTKKYDVIITEIGGTVGDIESLPYIESLRQLKWELGRNAVSVHLTYVPYLSAAGELKSKPTQHSVQKLHRRGGAAGQSRGQMYCPTR